LSAPAAKRMECTRGNITAVSKKIGVMVVG
jgi:hypothetical protein